MSNLQTEKRASGRAVTGAAKGSICRPAQNEMPPVRGRRGQRLGYLVANGQTMPVPCIVRDLDAGAATLLVGGWLGIPDSFSLYVEPDRLRLECVIAERRGNAVTVHFAG